MEQITEERELKCVLTKAEEQVYSKDLAKKIQDRAGCEEDLKVVKADFKDKITRQEADISGLARKVSNGYEYRKVKCDWTFDWEENKKRLYRTDSGELVDTQSMSEYERQEHFKFDDEVEQPEDETPRVTDPEEPEGKKKVITDEYLANIDPSIDPDQACIKCGYILDECECSKNESA